MPIYGEDIIIGGVVDVPLSRRVRYFASILACIHQNYTFEDCTLVGDPSTYGQYYHPRYATSGMLVEHYTIFQYYQSHLKEALEQYDRFQRFQRSQRSQRSRSV